MTDTEDNIGIFENTEDMNAAAAEYFISITNQSIASKGRCAVALSGGETPLKLFSLLASPSYSERIQWIHIYFFWGDERCVPLEDSRNNAFQAKKTLLDKVQIPSDHIHRIPVQLPPDVAADQYEKQVQFFFDNKRARFDLILLGLGENGHTASLFPGTEVLDENVAGIRSVYVEEEKMHRITMTAPLINQAHHILFLVSGKKKAAVIKTILNGPYQPYKYPAQLIRPEKGSLQWYIDREAAASLNS